MATGQYNAKSIPPREVQVDTLEILDVRTGRREEYSLEILEAEEELNVLLHELWPEIFILKP